MAPNAVDSYQARITYVRSDESIKIEPLELTEFPRKSRLSEFANNVMQKLRKNDKKSNLHEDWIDVKDECDSLWEAENLEIKEKDLEIESDVPHEITSELLTTKNLTAIAPHLPAKTFGKKWDLIYGTSEHGFSLQSLYRKSRSWGLINELYHDVTPTLLVVKDTSGRVFGAVLSCLPRVNNNRFVGSGESFLFQLTPELRIYSWTGLNDSILNCGFDCLRVGGSKKGEFGLLLDNDLRFGRSMKCETFNNEVLSSSEDFEILEVELWGFVA